MNRILMTILVAAALAFPMRASEVDQLKSDLIGQTMGGREKSWKFQSLDQIKELVIKNKKEDSHRRVYTIALQLQATNTGQKYAAEAQVECVKTDTGWKLKQVGLLSLQKMK